MNKHIGDVDNGLFQLEVYECGCGFHIGVDATYLDQVGAVSIVCPSCKEEIKIEAFDDEDRDDDGEEEEGEALEINHELVLSTVHITESDAKILDSRVNNECGITSPDDHQWRILVSEARASVAESEGYSAAYAHLLYLAIEKNCKWLVLDADGPKSKNLPTFKW